MRSPCLSMCSRQWPWLIDLWSLWWRSLLHLQIIIILPWLHGRHQQEHTFIGGDTLIYTSPFLGPQSNHLTPEMFKPCNVFLHRALHLSVALFLWYKLTRSLLIISNQWETFQWSATLRPISQKTKNLKWKYGLMTFLGKKRSDYSLQIRLTDEEHLSKLRKSCIGISWLLSTN